MNTLEAREKQSAEDLSGVSEAARRKLRRLEELLRGYDALVVAYSGGVDSTFLAVAAGRILGKKALAATADSESLPERERRTAEECAARFGFRHRFVRTKELTDERYAANDRDRCRYCKLELMRKLRQLAAEEGGARIALGAVTDDATDIRPGETAAAECGAVFPLKEAGLSKDEVRELSRALGLPTWDRPAAPCLSSRIAFGERVTAEKLRRVGQAEEFLHRLGFPECRVRLHGPVARIEVPKDRLADLSAVAEKVNAELCAAGFIYVAADLAGLHSGSLHKMPNRSR